MNAVVLAQQTQLDLLDAAVAAAAEFNGCLVRLFKNNLALSPLTLLADLSVADFHGYADSAAVTWGTAFLDPAQQPTINGDLKSFVATTPFSNPNIIYGWALIDSGATKLLAARLLDAPVNITAIGQAVKVLPAIPAFLPE